MPPLNHLLAFEAAVRHESFTQAAEELQVTQGAISRHVRTLEEYLGFELMERVNNSLQIPLRSRMYANEISRAFDEINKASEALQQHKHRVVLTVHGYTGFITNWLVPRLPAFQAAHPRTDIRLSSAREEANFDTDGVDVAVQIGYGNWPRLHADLLFRFELVPVCTPGYARRLELSEPERLLRATIYHTQTRREEWPKWFALVSDQPFTPARDVFSEDATVGLQCVLAGMGVGLTPRHYVSRHIAAERLIIPFDIPLRHRLGFYFVCPHDRLDLPKNGAFRDWIVGEAMRGTNDASSPGSTQSDPLR